MITSFLRSRVFVVSTTTAVLISSLTMMSTSAASTVDLSKELANVAAANSAGESVWALNLRPGWDSKKTYRVSGSGQGTNSKVRLLVSPTNTISWVIGGEQLASILVKKEYRTKLRSASLTAVKFVELDNDNAQHLLVKDSYAVDASVNRSAVAAWAASIGTITRTTDGSTITYSTRLDPDTKIPAGIAALFYPDGKNPIEVTINVRNNVIKGYKFVVRDAQIPRTLVATVTAPPSKLEAPTGSQIIKLSVLFNIFASADAPRNLIPSVLRQVKPSAGLTAFRTALQKAAVFADIDVAATSTGMVIFPGYPISFADQFEEARCLIRDSNWEARTCTEQDEVVLPAKLDSYADSVRTFAARGPATATEEYHFYSSLGHQLWLYSGLEFTPDELASWTWFMIEITKQAHRASSTI